MDSLGKLFCCEAEWDIILEFKGGMEVLDLWERIVKATKLTLPEVYNPMYLMCQVVNSHMILCQIMGVPTETPHFYNPVCRARIVKAWVYILKHSEETTGFCYELTKKETTRAHIMDAVYACTVQIMKKPLDEKWCYIHPDISDYVLQWQAAIHQVHDLVGESAPRISNVVQRQLVQLFDDDDFIYPRTALDLQLGINMDAGVDELADELFEFMEVYVLSGVYQPEHRIRISIAHTYMENAGMLEHNLVMMKEAAESVINFMSQFLDEDERFGDLADQYDNYAWV